MENLSQLVTQEDDLCLHVLRIMHHCYGEGRKQGRSAPAYRIIPLNVVDSVFETRQNAQKNLSRISFLPLKNVPLIGVRLYLQPQNS
jgi:hypothetical protein